MSQSIMLTPKDCLYIEDMLQQSLTLNKRLAHEVTLLQDKDLINQVNEVMEKLAKEYHCLVTMLKEGENYAGK